MNVALPTMFAFAAACSLAAFWHAVSSNLAAVSELRRLVSLPEYGSLVTVTFRQHLGDFDPVMAVRRPRQVRVPAPKPVTHRLHQFSKDRVVA